MMDDEDDERMMIGIDFGTFKIDTGLCGEEEGFVTLKTPEDFRWEYLDQDLASQDAFERGMRFSSNYTRLEAKRTEVGIAQNGVVMSIPSFQRANVYAKVLEIGYETLNFDKFLYVDQLYLAMYVYCIILLSQEILTRTPLLTRTPQVRIRKNERYSCTWWT